MAYDDCVVKIEKLANGFEVEIYEPTTSPGGSSNAMRGAMGSPEPWKGYAFTSVDEVINFLKSKLPTVKTPTDMFSEGFADATEDDEEE